MTLWESMSTLSPLVLRIPVSPLPSLRKRILRSFLILVMVYSVLGVFLVLGVVTSSRTTPKLLHVNYDSIASANLMQEALDGVQNPKEYSEKTPQEWKNQFETALRFGEGNVTESGELETLSALRKRWDS